jgi:hypothetical protein
MAKAKTAAKPSDPSHPPAAPRRPHSMVWLQGLLCGAVVTLATPTALLLGVLLGPALASLVLDRRPGRPTARCIVLCSTAASVQPIRILWAAGHTMAASTALLADLRVVGTAWSAAAGGWLLAELAPVVVRVVLEGLSRSRAARLRAERQELVEAWGLDPGSTPDQ